MPIPWAEVGVEPAERDLSAVGQSLKREEELSRERECILIAPGSIPRSLLRTFNFEIWKLKCLGACPEDLYSTNFWESSSLRFSTRIGELVPLSWIDSLFSILRLPDRSPLSIRAIRDGMRFSITKRSGVYGDPGASFDPVGAVQDQQEANGRCSRISMELLSDFVIECRRNAPTWRLDSEKLIAT